MSRPEPRPHDLYLAREHGNIRDLVRESSLPVWLVTLRERRLIEVSDALASMFGTDREQLLQREVTELVVDQAAARSRIALLASGELDSYRVRGLAYRRADGETFLVDVCLSACSDDEPRRLAVGVVLPASEGTGTLGMPANPGTSHAVVLGTVDEHWRIDRISVDVEQLLGYPVSDVVGQSISVLVQPDDLPNLLTVISQGLQGQGGATMRLHVRRADGRSQLCRAQIAPLAGVRAPGFGFALAAEDPRVPDVATRAWELEGHLQRIAREIAASGVLAGLLSTPAATSVPAMAGLSARELEIVSGLVAGERVQMIAKRMFLSQSTVRNHLTSVYRKLGVRSQQELLTLLRSDLTTDPYP
ncbi:MAG: Response regulator containing a CheY-like receiver domain and an DNA-binding domain [Frankiales bacterium]|jgi:PAS domain S-box-containing protein|nr:Response regulator containing a CheY-like receiver domain and an DNA-binding domain [Frankiales bacterium]